MSDSVTSATPLGGREQVAVFEDPEHYGVMAEFRDVDSLLHAAEVVHKSGYVKWDTYSPFPVHGMDRVMDVKATCLPWIVLICGITGMIGGLFLVWYTNVSTLPVPDWLRGYPYIVSGKPFFSLPANIPVIFETTVLLSGFGTVIGMFWLNRLPRHHHPLLASERFRRATSDGFFIAIEAQDPLFDAKQTSQMLESLGATHVELVKD
jgi:hypothetical protein